MISPNRETFYNILSSLASMLASIVAMFLVYRVGNNVLGVELIGLWSVVATVTSLGNIGTFGLSGSLVKFSAEARARDEIRMLPGLINGVLWRMGGLLAIFLLILYLIARGGLRYFLDESSLGSAISLLPLSFLVFWVNTIAQLYLSAIEGLNRIWQKNLVLICGHLILAFLAVEFISKYGIFGILYAQLAQMVFLLFGGYFLMKLNITGYSILRWEVNAGGVNNAIHYGIRFQAQSVLQMLGEPVTKMFLSRYGGLSIVGYYEMASRLVLQLRQIVLVIMNSLLPRLVQVHALGTTEKLERTYRRIFAVNFDLSALSFGALFLFCPILIHIWLGEYVPEMIRLTRLLGLAWFVNACAIVPYLFNLSSARLKANLISHSMMAGFNIVLCLLVILLNMEDYCFVYAAMISLLVGSIFLIAEYGRRHHISVLSLFSMDHLLMAAVGVFSAIVLFISLGLGIFPAYITYSIVMFFFVGLAILWIRRSVGFYYVRTFLTSVTNERNV